MCIRDSVETPEGIDLLLRPAGVVPRALAYTIDLCIRGLIMLVLMLGLAFLGKLGAGLGLLLTFIMTWWYTVSYTHLSVKPFIRCAKASGLAADRHGKPCSCDPTGAVHDSAPAPPGCKKP